MKTIKERVQNELAEVMERVPKLSKFITSDARFLDLSEEHQKLLVEQLVHMDGYSSVLSKRLALLDAESA